MLTRLKTIVFILIISGIFILSCEVQNEIINSHKPNVLFILVDDLGVTDLSCMGSTFYETPNVDRLANNAIVFTEGYSASRVCSPSRASIMTGKFTARHGITDWIGARSGEAWRDHNRHDLLLPASYIHSLPKEDIILPESMKAAGYKTFFAGKWHLGSEGSYPEDHGFDINKGGWEKGSPIGGYFSPWENPSLPNMNAGENLSMRLAMETAEFIKANKDSAFFAFLSFYAVHGPIQTTEEKWSKYQIKATQNGVADTGYVMENELPIRQVQDNPVYAGLVEHMDDAVGFVLNTLEELGLDENTIIIFTSDNGGVASGDSFSTTNLPFRGGKGYQWEGGTRVPLFIAVPGSPYNGVTSNIPVIGTDLYPTILDLVDIELIPDQHKDGISLKPVLADQELQDRTMYWHYPHYGNQGGEPSSIIRESKWKLIQYYEDGRLELYDLMNDVEEQNDVLDEYPEIAQQLSVKLNQWLTEVGAKAPTYDPEYNPQLDQERRDRIENELMPKLEKERLEFLSPEFQPNENWWGSKVVLQ